MCDNRRRVINAGDVVKGRLHLKDVDIPCGYCAPCKQRRVREWTFRLLKEEERSSSSFFITLTYDTDHVPISDNGFMTLRKKDYQDYMKRLRKIEWEQGNKMSIKYYACGEYGGKTNRPHFHAIIYNVSRYENINTAWQKGTTHIGTVEEASISYTAKYIDKPRRIPMFKADDRVKEFSLMSKHLGDNYLSAEIQEYHNNDIERNYSTLPNGVKVPLSKYYRDKIYSEAQKEEQRVKILLNREEKEAKRIQDIGYDAYIRETELNKIQRSKIFFDNQKTRE